MTEDERMARTMSADSRSLLLHMGATEGTPGIDSDGWRNFNRTTPGFRGMPTCLYNWEPIDAHGPAIRVRLTERGHRVRAILVEQENAKGHRWT